MNISILTTDIRSEHDVMLTRQRARQIAALLGFDMQDQTRIATAVSEIARNAVQHAGGGKVAFQLANGIPQLFRILIKDDGPGIADVEHILKQGLSSSEQGDSLRGVRRLMDEFCIETAPGRGTVVTLSKRRSRLLPMIERKEMARITEELRQRVSENPLAEMQRQNQELLHTLEALRAQQEALRLQQEERAEHLKEIETLNHRLRRAMTETHHRVKNNLQVISALIDMQKQSGQETVPISELVRLGQNIQALGVIHDILTKESKGGGDALFILVNEVLDRFLPHLQASLGERRLLTQLMEVSLPGKQATALALITNELVANAVKHGKGDVEVTLRTDGTRVTLEVCDDGPGFAEGFDPETAAHTGLELIENIARHDLRAKTSYENRTQGGGRVVLNFPI
jgi:two-component sensor histidine kinase